MLWRYTRDQVYRLLRALLPVASLAVGIGTLAWITSAQPQDNIVPTAYNAPSYDIVNSAQYKVAMEMNDSLHGGHHDHHNMHHVMTTVDPHAHHHMDHGDMDHANMDHSGMDHSGMDHSQMDHSQMDHGNHGEHVGADHGMAMYFHLGTSETILFKGWQTNSWQAMLGSCVLIFVMACLYEGLKVLRESLLKRAQVQTKSDSQQVPTDENATIINNGQPSIRNSMLSLAHLLQSVLHVLQVVVSYFLMLIFMTYNVYLCLAVALGAGMGYFLFSWRRTMVVDINEHCH